MKKLLLALGIALVILAAALIGAREYFLYKAYSAPRPDLVSSPRLDRTEAESSVLLKLSLDLEFLQGLANQLIPSSFEKVEGDPTSALTEDRSKVRISRGPIAIDGNGGQVAVTVPITDGSYNVKGRFGVKRRNKGLLGWFESLSSVPVSGTVSSLRGQLKLTILPVLRPDWSINPQASLDLNVNKAHFNVKHVGRISVRGEVEDAFDDAKGDTLKDFATTLNEQARLRQRVADFWSQAFLVQKSTEDPFWLVVQPTAILSAPTEVNDGKVNFFLGLRASTEVVLAEEAPTNAPTPLPSITIDDSSNFGAWSFNVPVSLDYELLSQLLSREASKLAYSDNGVRVKIEEAAVFPHGKEIGVRVNLVIRPDWWSKAKAELYVYAEPVLDANNKKLALSNIRFDVESESVLVNSLGYLTRPLLISELSKAALIDLAQVESEAIERVTSESQSLLTGLPEFVNASLNVESIRLQEFVVASDRAYLVLTSAGTATAELLSLDEIN